MKKIVVVTTTRAEYGLLKPLIQRIRDDSELELCLIVSGTHLSKRYGYTIDEIIKDGLPISYEIPIIADDNTAYGISLTMANAIKGFAKTFRDDRSDMVVILGDRTEMLGVASAAMNERIPIAHIHGGEVTEGAVDDCVRHAITKMSYLHFTSTEVYRKRVIQLGESPDRVFNVGALGAENILSQKLYDEDNIRNDIGIPEGMKYAVVTYHPVTLGTESIEYEIRQLCSAMKYRTDLFFVITSANADEGGEKVNALLKEFCDENENAVFVYNLGMERYLSAVKYAAFVLGNSSSGIIEAPVLGTPTVNIGDRQKGRLMAESVYSCSNEKQSIDDAIINVTKNKKKIYSSIYGNGKTSLLIVDKMRMFLEKDRCISRKLFYDI